MATISKSVLIAPSDPSLRLFLQSTKARSLQRSFSKSSSRSKVIAHPLVSPLGDTLRQGPHAPEMGERRDYIQGTLIVSLSLAGIPGTVKIDRFWTKFNPFSRGYCDVCMRHQDYRRAGTNGRATRRDLGPWPRPFSLPLREAPPAGRVSAVNEIHDPGRGRLALNPGWLGAPKRAESCT